LFIDDSLVTAGSVDDGKSTLIGRLLYDTKQILEDQLEHVVRTSMQRGDMICRPDNRPVQTRELEAMVC
jgi:sulfate adenylyltransferase subunit 1 (EFTu-like GTPase family)